MLRRLTQTTGQTLNSFRRLAAADRVSSFRFMQRVLLNQIAINHRDNRCNQRAAPHLSTDAAEATQPDLATHQFRPAQNILLHHQVHQIASFIFKKKEKETIAGSNCCDPFLACGASFHSVLSASGTKVADSGRINNKRANRAESRHWSTCFQFSLRLQGLTDWTDVDQVPARYNHSSCQLND